MYNFRIIALYLIILCAVILTIKKIGLKNLISKIWGKIQATTDNIDNKFSRPSQIRRNIILLAICYCYICVAGFIVQVPMQITEKYKQEHTLTEREKAIEAINSNSSNIQVDLSGYTMVSEPVGIDNSGFYAGKEWGEFFIDFRATVYKNTDIPLHSIISVEWEIFDRQGNSIGIVRSQNTKNMNKGMSVFSSVINAFDISENNIPTYNGKEIGKMVCISIEETDNQVQLLKSEFAKKKEYLQEYINNGDKDGFNSALNQVLALYPAEMFPDENWELNELLRTTNEHFVEEEAQAKDEGETVKEEAARLAEQSRQNAEKLKERMVQDELNTQQDYIDSCSYAVSQDLLRNPSTYQNKPVYVSGGVTSVVNLQRGKLEAMLEAAGISNSENVEEIIITDMYGEIAILYDSSVTGKRFLEGDSIGVYGVMLGLTEITSTNVFGAEATRKIPQVRLKYYE